MSSATEYYLITIAIYAGCNGIMTLGLNLQFGLTGILNFCFYILVAVGGYAAALTAIGPVSPDFAGSVQYIGGWQLPWPVPVIAAGLAGAVLAVLIALIAVRRLRSDYLAIATLGVGEVVWLLTGNTSSLVNGWSGLTNVPEPPNPNLSMDPLTYSGLFCLIVLAITVIGFVITERLTRSPLGRALRAIRENEETASACGKNVFSLRLQAMILGGILAAVGGALFIEYIGSISPNLWDIPETFILFAALIIGGRGNNWGAVLGAALVPVGFFEATRFLPTFTDNPNVLPALRWVVIGALVYVFLLFRPNGLLPEQKTLRRERPPLPAQAPEEDWGRITASISPQLQLVQPQAATAMETALRIDSISKSYGGVRALDHCSFTVNKGGITGLIGPNGAGKSTAMGIIAGAIAPDAGRVTFLDQPCKRPAYHVARLGIARSFQIPQEFPHLTVLENMMVASIRQPGERVWRALAGPRFWKAAERDALDHAWWLLERFQLGHQAHEYAANLSGGQKKLLELARSLQSRPQLLLLDEPIAGINPELASQIEEHIAGFPSEGITVLIVEHEMGLVRRLCDPVIVMAQGRVLSEGSFDQIAANEEVVSAYLGA